MILTAGRMLEGYDMVDTDGSIIISNSFTYDEKGIRTLKTVNGKTTYYTTIDGTITSQYERDELGEVVNEMVFLYDSQGNLIGFTYGGNTYFYIKNHMNDVMGIADANGTWLVGYNYDAYGLVNWQYETNSEAQTDIDLTELAELNPMLYKSYYCDRETGIYYLQSRYYITDFGRFVNADLPEYAKLQKDDYAGTNLFTYCNNDPVNHSDPTGYWGKEVHDGFKRGFYDSSNTVIEGRRFFYGTYFWAKSKEVGFSKSDAKKIAKYCNALDDVYPSTKYALNLTSSKKHIYYDWQFYHFNEYKSSISDSRISTSNKWFDKAVSLWKKKKRDEALKWLGYGLHCIQDIEAHGRIGAGSPIPQHIKSPKNSNYNWEKADTPIGYEWKNNKYTLSFKKNSTKRLYETEKRTKEYLKKFIRKVGYKK